MFNLEPWAISFMRIFLTTSDILLRGGSAVDASITSLLCVGVVNAHTSGLGGGMLMLIYHKSTGKADALIARERAPSAVQLNMTKADQYLGKSKNDSFF